MSSLWNREYEFLSYLISLDSWVEPTADKEIMLEMITSAVVKKGKESEIKDLLALIDSKEPFTWKEKVLLTSLAIQAPNRKDLKPIQLAAMPAIFKEKNKFLDENKWAMLENMFHWPQKNIISQKDSKSFLDEKSLICGRPTKIFGYLFRLPWGGRQGNQPICAAIKGLRVGFGGCHYPIADCIAWDGGSDGGGWKKIRCTGHFACDACTFHHGRCGYSGYFNLHSK